MRNYEIRGTIGGMEADTYERGAFDNCIQDLECLVPYLSVDREAMCTSRSWYNSGDGHIVIAVETSPIDDVDMAELLTCICARWFDTYSVGYDNITIIVG